MASLNNCLLCKGVFELPNNAAKLAPVKNHGPGPERHFKYP